MQPWSCWLCMGMVTVGHCALSRKEGPISLSLLLIMQVMSLVPSHVNKAMVLRWWENLWVREFKVGVL